MMHSLRRRIEALEKIRLAARYIDPEILSHALFRIQDGDAERLISALRAEREGRELTADEFAAKQLYRKRLSQLSHGDSIEGFEYVVDIREVMKRVLLEHLRPVMHAIIRAQEAQREGRALEAGGVRRFGEARCGMEAALAPRRLSWPGRG